jgi:DNA/RNA-binding domain of Phe-tRNA-synthetase-like protein
MKLKISERMGIVCPELRLGGMVYQVKSNKVSAELTVAFEAEKNEVKERLKDQAISQLQAIHAARRIYKKLGKDPTRYRVSSESLLRRVQLDKGLDSVNGIVDCLNIASMRYGLSIGGYDLSAIGNELLFDVGLETDLYEAVGRGVLNIEGIPVLRDEKGAFGSTTTDSERAKITSGVEQVLFNIIAFDGAFLEETMTLLDTLLTEYLDLEKCETFIVAVE